MMNPHPHAFTPRLNGKCCWGKEPGAFWDQTLKLQQLLAKKTPRNKCYEPDETNVVVSVTDRSQRDLSKRFDEMDIDWEVVEEQLMAWSHLLREGRRLRIDISFIYKETTQAVTCRALAGVASASICEFARSSREMD
ncbi:hypothetical protein B0H66DRAFT_99088 [Apodospora peruviana]|uniref:Uncharacterized protein n=1 Tax=Apodospora peruviana TaxID=516989 RepID=A0AAE0IUK4_9PEZI|nr:hypothetical protein B0H66DRAFT_99088 [Apodospora peruviana]